VTVSHVGTASASLMKRACSVLAAKDWGTRATVALLGDGDDVLKLPELHDSSPLLLNGIGFRCWTA
jgi:hypothetical protein